MLTGCVELLRWKWALKAALLGILVQCLGRSRVLHGFQGQFPWSCQGCSQGLELVYSSGSLRSSTCGSSTWSCVCVWWFQVVLTNCTEVSVVLLQNSVWILRSCYNGNSVRSVATAKIHYPNSCLPTLPFMSVCLLSRVLRGIKQ